MLSRTCVTYCYCYLYGDDDEDMLDYCTHPGTDWFGWVPWEHIYMQLCMLLDVGASQ
jgi:hypothetical protein